jgi:hypothetical protein
VVAADELDEKPARAVARMPFTFQLMIRLTGFSLTIRAPAPRFRKAYGRGREFSIVDCGLSIAD